MFNTKNPTITAINTAINTAIKNGERDMNNYNVTEQVKNFFLVQHKTQVRRAYAVTTLPGCECCNCEYFEMQGTCKHIYIAVETAKIEAEEAKLSDPDYIGYIAG